VKLRRISDDEMPLQLCLSWTVDDVNSLDHYQFVLQENDTGEILVSMAILLNYCFVCIEFCFEENEKLAILSSIRLTLA